MNHALILKSGWRDYAALLRLLTLMEGQKVILTVTIVLGLVNQAAVIAIGGVSAYVVGAAVTGTAFEALHGPLWFLAGLVVTAAIVAWLEMWLAHDLAYRVLASIRNRLYEALERLAPAYLAKRRSGDVASAAMADVETLEWFYAHTLGSFFVCTLVPAIVLVFLGSFHPLLPLLLTPLVLMVAFVPAVLAKRASRQGDALREKLGEVNAEVVDGVQGLRELTLFGAGERMLQKITRHGESLVQQQLTYGKRAGLERSVTNGLTALGMLTILAFSAHLVANGDMAAQWFPVTVILSGAVFGPVAKLSSTAANLGVIVAAANRVLDLLSRQPPVEDKVSTAPAGDIVPRVSFENVSFGYEENGPDALKGASFSIEPGETIALVGHSGAGKSTCANLLMRFFDPTSGRICLGGHDLKDFPQIALRERISLVPQELYLFHADIRENIRLGRPEASEEEVTRAAQQAVAHVFISDLPKGYETIAGERGVRLSGGQRQRIAIARAFLKNAPVLIMDEAVSNLDTESEQALQTAMTRLREGRTNLIIAHRLSTIRSADRIVVLEQGRVVEVGTHDALVEKNGVYANLVSAQLKKSGEPAEASP